MWETAKNAHFNRSHVATSQDFAIAACQMSSVQNPKCHPFKNYLRVVFIGVTSLCLVISQKMCIVCIMYVYIYIMYIYIMYIYILCMYIYIYIMYIYIYHVYIDIYIMYMYVWRFPKGIPKSPMFDWDFFPYEPSSYWGYSNAPGPSGSTGL